MAAFPLTAAFSTLSPNLSARSKAFSNPLADLSESLLSAKAIGTILKIKITNAKIAGIFFHNLFVIFALQTDFYDSIVEELLYKHTLTQYFLISPNLAC